MAACVAVGCWARRFSVRVAPNRSSSNARLIGATYGSHDVFGTVEAVKAVSELYMPVAGEVVEINGRLDGEPALINTDPYGDGWMIKVRVAAGGDAGLLSAAEYKGVVGE